MKKKLREDVDLCDFIHTVEFIINRFPISQATYDYYSGHENLYFDIVRSPDRQYSHLKIVLPDIKRIKIKSLEDLKIYLQDFISKITHTADRLNLLKAYNTNRIRIYSLHIFNRVYYKLDKDFLSLFHQIKDNSRLFALLLPHLESCDNSNENSLYLNMTNKKNIIIYDEMGKRNLPAIKLEMRFNRRDNIKSIFKLDKSSAANLSVRRVEALSITELMKRYNKYIDSFNKSLVLKKYRKCLDETKAEIIDIANLLSIHIHEDELNDRNLLNIYLTILANRKDSKKHLAKKRKYQKGNLLLNYRYIDDQIKKTIKSKYQELFVKLYPEEEEENINGITDENFFRLQIPSYSYVLSFFDFNDRERYKWITPSIVANLRASIRESRVFNDLSPDEEEWLKSMTLKKLTLAISKIEKQYRFNKTKSRSRKNVDQIYSTLFGEAFNTTEDELKEKFKGLAKIYLSHSPEKVRLTKEFQHFFNSFKFEV